MANFTVAKAKNEERKTKVDDNIKNQESVKLWKVESVSRINADYAKYHTDAIKDKSFQNVEEKLHLDKSLTIKKAELRNKTAEKNQKDQEKIKKDQEKRKEMENMRRQTENLQVSARNQYQQGYQPMAKTSSPCKPQITQCNYGAFAKVPIAIRRNSDKKSIKTLNISVNRNDSNESETLKEKLHKMSWDELARKIKNDKEEQAIYSKLFCKSREADTSNQSNGKKLHGSNSYGFSKKNDKAKKLFERDDTTRKASEYVDSIEKMKKQQEWLQTIKDLKAKAETLK